MQEKKSDYEADKLKQEWKKQKAVIRNIANYPLILNDGTRKERKRNSAREADYSNLGSLERDVEMMRIRNFNGVNVIVTIRLGPEMLTILGDLKKGKDVKVIEIPR